MSKKEMFVKAHKMTKEIKKQYPEVNYKFQFALCLAYLQEEGENEMVEMKGTEKQVAWAKDIKEIMNTAFDYIFENFEATNKIAANHVESLKVLNQNIANETDSSKIIEVLSNLYSLKEKQHLDEFILKDIIGRMGLSGEYICKSFGLEKDHLHSVCRKLI